MNEYSIHISNGKVIGDSAFVLFAIDLLEKECRKLCDFTDALDKAHEQKKEQIAEYKCAKYRYASISLIQSIIQNNNRSRKLHNIEHSHYLLLPFDEIFKTQTEYLTLYESAPANEKPDYSLYYTMQQFAANERMKLEAKLPNAGDWKKIELKERIGGLNFAKECLAEAWQKRKAVEE